MTILSFVVLYFFVFLMGTIFGSFLNVCIYRMPREESIIMPPSHCTGCGSRLKAPDLVPVFSFVFLKGKCRHCGVRISPRYPLIELLTATVFMILFYKYFISVEFIAAAYLMAILIAVFFIDLDHKIIPDQLVVAGLAGALPLTVYNFFKPVQIFGETYWLNRLLGLLPGTGTLFLIAVIGLIIYKTDDAMGMGDVKLFAPIGIFLGWKLCLLTLMLSVVLAGVTSIILILTKIKSRKDTIPFGPFIVIGTFIAIVWGTDIINWYMNSISN
ncbi:MAG: prepilin peptidase [Clostridia bacterium]|nr:prepilin peptidase [Clostridia bacterium]